jgi:hypothetical protein
MNNRQSPDDDNLFPRRKHNFDLLTQNEIASILRWADSHSLTGQQRLKLLLVMRERKRSARAKQRN